ncbi:2-(3-amino-3-carboxypropyl)histidine synthase subunit 1, partial [Mucuna pruriens]
MESEQGKGEAEVLLVSPSSQKPINRPKRFVKSQIPDSILNDPLLNAAISILPSNYNFEVHKSVWRVRSTGAKRVALQFPEGLLMYSLPLSDIFTTFAAVSHCYILGDVTYGACCVDDFAAAALGADLLIHYGHSCLVPIDSTTLPCLYVFVDIKIDVHHFVETVRLNLESRAKTLVVAGTIQFASAIRTAKPELEELGFRVLIPQSKPLSAGEVLGCTAPKVSSNSLGNEISESVLVFVADGRFHLEAFMIANPGIKAFRYDPYMGKLFLEEYDHVGMKQSRRNAVMKAREARSWGVVLGTLGRQGNPRILERLEKKMMEKGFDYTVVLMSELSPGRIALFEDSVDAWIQIACPRLSIDWGEAFVKPVLTPFEAEVALGVIPGWWEKTGCEDGVGCNKSGSCCGDAKGRRDFGGDYPMDYYAQDGGEWNSSYVKKSSRPARRLSVSSVADMGQDFHFHNFQFMFRPKRVAS